MIDKLGILMMLLVLNLLVVGCTAGDFCEVSEPILWESEESFSQIEDFDSQLNTQVLEHNGFGAEACGW